MNLLVFLEVSGGKVKRPALEALGEARRLAQASGGTVSVVALGTGARAAIQAARGARKAYVDESGAHSAFHLNEAAGAILAAWKASGADGILLAATSVGAELAPALAAELGTAVAADALEVSWRDNALFVKRPIYAGKAFAVVRFRKLPAIVTLRPNVFAEEPGGEPPSEVLPVTQGETDGRARVVDVVEPEVKKVDLTEADIIVSGGRGLKGPEGFSVLESFARTLGGVVGASRAVCDAGWRPHSDQVGQTGKTVSTRLYFACGISGAIQHLAGMSSSKTIVAINKDPNAPIFQVADYGIVGDLFEVVPALETEVRKLR